MRLPEPDLNIVCFFLYHDRVQTLPLVNELNEAIYAELSGPTETQPGYMITRTRLTSPAYDGAIAPLLVFLDADAERYWSENAREGLVVLRVTVMNPFFSAPQQNHVDGLISALREAAERALRRF